MELNQEECSIELLSYNYFVITVHRHCREEPMREIMGHIRPIAEYFEANQEEFMFVCSIKGMAFLRDDSEFQGIKVGGVFGGKHYGFRVFYGKITNQPSNMKNFLRKLLLQTVRFFNWIVIEKNKSQSRYVARLVRGGRVPRPIGKVLWYKDMEFILAKEFPEKKVKELFKVPYLMKILFGSELDARMMLDTNPYWLISEIES